MTESVKLNIGERFMLVKILPKEGNPTNYKVLRELKETLSPDEEESEQYGFTVGHRCPHRIYDGEGKATQCEYTQVAEAAGKCPIHDELMMPDGNLYWKPESANIEKEIELGKKAKQIIVEALKTNKLPEQYFSLYEKLLDEE